MTQRNPLPRVPRNTDTSNPNDWSACSDQNHPHYWDWPDAQHADRTGVEVHSHEQQSHHQRMRKEGNA